MDCFECQIPLNPVIKYDENGEGATRMQCTGCHRVIVVSVRVEKRSPLEKHQLDSKRNTVGKY